MMRKREALAQLLMRLTNLALQLLIALASCDLVISNA
jgi:hypothetical protein